jgi:DNA-binding transcriptional ArsR family regulator
MVNQDIVLNQTFAALADPTRRAILSRLTQGTTTVTDLAEPFAMSLPAVSKHLVVLEKAGLLTRQKQGRIHYLSLNAAPLKEVANWIQLYEQFWEGQLKALANFLESQEL